jgi:hypothetical protein
MTKQSPITSGIRQFVAWLTELSYIKLGTAYASMIIAIGALYAVMYRYAPHHAPNLGDGTLLTQFLNGIYFSIITAASVGYGDISPHGYSKVVASIESLGSLFVFAILVSKTISERQEAALYQMHKLTLDDIFTSIREGFYVIRKDFDAIMEEVKTTRALSVHGKDNFETALHHGEVLIEDIPTFYDSERRLYVIDIRRERLLAEAVERTFERLLTTCNILKKGSITFPEHTQAVLDEFMRISIATLTEWRRHSSEAIHPSIDRSITLIKSAEL